MSFAFWDFLTKVIRSLNNYSGLLTVVTTAVLVYITWQILKVSNKPEVIISHRATTDKGVWPPSFTSHICVQNVGQSLARKVRFESDDFSKTPYGGKSLENIKFLMDGIDVLAPGQEECDTHTYVDRGGHQEESLQIKVHITYEDSRGKIYKPKIFTLEF